MRHVLGYRGLRYLSSCAPRHAMKIVPVPVRNDNYAYLLIDDATQQAAVVDPYDFPKLETAVQKLGVKITAALTTHHHFDHSGGNKVRAVPSSESVDMETRLTPSSPCSGFGTFLLSPCIDHGRCEPPQQADKYPEAIIYGGSEQIPALTKLVKDKDQFTIGANINVLSVSFASSSPPDISQVAQLSCNAMSYAGLYMLLRQRQV